MSFTITLALQLAEFPEGSVPVRITGLIPTSAQEKVDLSRVNKAIEQLSVEPLFILDVVVDAFPELSR